MKAPRLPERFKVYGQLRACDDGRVDIKHTRLLSGEIWAAPGS